MSIGQLRNVTPIMTSPALRTASGASIWPLDENPGPILITDIAHALARLCRWGGHTSEFYSVAEHSVRVSLACAPEDALWGLLHDASEAYLLDLPRPLKYVAGLEDYRAAEARLQRHIYETFGLHGAQPASVDLADDVVLATECRDLTKSFAEIGPCLPAPLVEAIRPWPSGQAQLRFLGRFLSLCPIQAQEASEALWSGVF
jgi:uncharacterized protein